MSRTEVPGVVMIYVPCGSDEEASRIAAALLDARLIACANIYESRSIYRWDGRLTDERESVLICKTTAERAADVEQRVLELHSYQVPCVLRLETVHANKAYADWVAGEVAGPAPNIAASTG